MVQPRLKDWLSRSSAELVEAIANDIHEHVKELVANGIDFYGYALLPGEPSDIHSIVAVTNSEADIGISRTDAQYRYYRLCVDEWAHWDHDCFAVSNALLVEANRQFNELHTQEIGDFRMDEFEVAHAKILLQAVVVGLDLANHQGAFGGRQPFLAVWISDSGHSVIFDSVKRLNPAGIAAEFMQEFGLSE